jgi:phytanoyl-CoA hydroxylase
MPMLTSTQLEEFAAEGYLVVDDVLDQTDDIIPVLDEYSAILDGIARRLYSNGTITSLHEDLPFTGRLTAVYAESGRLFNQHFDLSLPFKGITKDTPINTGAAMLALLTNENLLDVVESVIGPEIFSCPVQHTRTKLPKGALGSSASNGQVGPTPWHQDNGVLLPEADQSTVLTVWLPLSESTVQNGALRVIPRSHTLGKLFEHCLGHPGGLRIPDSQLPPGKPRPLPMKPGSVLLMTQSTVHSSLDNVTTDQVRISLDLRYQPTGQPTGRPVFAPAGFVARSRSHPETELRDPARWRENWLALRDALAENAETLVFNRWHADSPVCA